MAELRKTSASGSNSTAASAFESGPAVIPPFDEAGFAARHDLDDLTVPWYDRPSKAAPYPPRPFLIHGEMVAARAAERPPQTEEPHQRRESEEQPAGPVRADHGPPRPSSTASRRSSTSASATATRPASRDATLTRHPSQASESSKPSTPKPPTPRPLGVGKTASSAPSLRTTPSPSPALFGANRPPTSMSTPGSSSFASPAGPPFNNSSILSSSLAFSSYLSSSADEHGLVPVLNKSGEVGKMIRLDDDPKSLSESSSSDSLDSSSDDDDAKSSSKKPRSSLPKSSSMAMATASTSARMPPPAAPKQKPVYKPVLTSSSSTSPTTSDSEGEPTAKKANPPR
ncbi:hypothetical protein AAVH_28520 [Aphelenchoides avenae]|nr:hypothetical protein AAVH_28520 [Aphelenchus avenae]